MNDETGLDRAGKLPSAAVESDKALLRDISEWIGEGSLRVEVGSASYFTLIGSRFPIGLNRINWSLVKNVLFHEILPLESRAHDEAERRVAMAAARGVLDRWFVANLVSNADEVVVVGDVSDLALHLNVGTLLNCYQVLFMSGQHVYVFPRFAEWCLNYTMEDQLWFGKATDALRTGYVEEES